MEFRCRESPKRKMNAAPQFLLTSNGASSEWSELPQCPAAEFTEATSAQLEQGGRLCAWFGVPEAGMTRLVAVVAFDAENTLAIARSEPFSGNYPSLTTLHPQGHLFEREICEQHELIPAGHPSLKPVRHYGSQGPAVGEFFQVRGAEVHEVAVGPVHAGVIEPGHFRFQCNGEEVLNLEIALGYQHRGIEEAIVGGPHRLTMSQMETIAGDTTIGHATAYAMICEALAGIEAPLRAQWLRAIALELERMANHVGDLGALANDVAFQPTAAACGKTRGDFLNLTALLCGNRFGRGLVRPGGCKYDLEPERLKQMGDKLRSAFKETEEAVESLWETSSVRARFEGVGTVSSEQAAEIGMVGVAARASGLVRDARFDHPAGWHRFAQIPVAVWPGGDVFARARVRWLEAQRSAKFIEEQLAAPPEDALRVEVGPTAPGKISVALVEGWRGECCHVAITDSAGRFLRYKIVDPSFHNWTGLSLALREQAISDFPLCNKSFNLSYCGVDL
jgi:Ni,Fe-hydrogenase III large subunit